MPLILVEWSITGMPVTLTITMKLIAIAMLWLTIVAISVLISLQAVSLELPCNNRLTVHVAIWWTTSTSMVTVHVQVSTIFKNKCEYITAFNILISLMMVWLLFAICLTHMIQICSAHCGGDGMTIHHDTSHTELQRSVDLLVWCYATACDDLVNVMVIQRNKPLVYMKYSPMSSATPRL